MKITPGLIVTAVAMLFFYFRMAQLRGRKRKQARQEALDLRRSKGRKKKGSVEQKVDFEHPRYEVRSWVMVVIAMLLMLAGVTMYTASWVPVAYDKYWWISATAGVLLFAFCFK